MLLRNREQREQQPLNHHKHHILVDEGLKALPSHPQPAYTQLWLPAVSRCTPLRWGALHRPSSSVPQVKHQKEKASPPLGCPHAAPGCRSLLGPTAAGSLGPHPPYAGHAEAGPLNVGDGVCQGLQQNHMETI